MMRRQEKLGFFIGSVLLISLPSFAISQTLEDNASLREYWCSLANVSVSYEGKDRYHPIEAVDRKPIVITVPMADRETITHEAFEDDGRFYSYIRYHEDRDDKQVVHGVFDLELEQFSTSTSAIVLGDDGVLLPISRSYAWSCSIKD